MTVAPIPLQVLLAKDQLSVLTIVLGLFHKTLAIGPVSDFYFVFLRRLRNPSLGARLPASMQSLRARGCSIQDIIADR